MWPIVHTSKFQLFKTITAVKRNYIKIEFKVMTRTQGKQVKIQFE